MDQRSETWQKTESESQKIGWRWVTHKIFVGPDGRDHDYTTFGQPGGKAAAVIALTPENNVVVARQFRVGPEAVFFELPGGGVEAGEDPAAAALRELREETGYTTDEELHYLGTVCRDAYTNELNYYFLAHNCRQTNEQQADDGEFVTPIEISIEELIYNATHTLMSDSAAVLLAYSELEQLQ